LRRKRDAERSPDSKVKRREEGKEYQRNNDDNDDETQAIETNINNTLGNNGALNTLVF